MDIDEEKLFSIRKLRRNHSGNKTKRLMKRKTVRRPRNSTRKWKVGEELLILEYFRNVIRQNQEIEKPTADVFYAKLIRDLNLEEASPTQTKNKVRHLKDSYIRAVKWMQQTGQDPESDWVRQCLLEICTHYDILAEIYGDKVDIDSSNVQPRIYFESNIDAADEVDEEKNEDSAQEFVNHEPADSDMSNYRLKQSIPKIDDQLHKNSSKTDKRAGDESLQCFKQFLTATSDAISRAFPSPSPSLASEPPPRQRATETSSFLESNWKMEELKLQHERLQLDKFRQEWERDIKDKELDIRKKEIETNERLRILEIEKEERMERFKIEQECKLQLDLASIRNANNS